MNPALVHSHYRVGSGQFVGRTGWDWGAG